MTSQITVRDKVNELRSQLDRRLDTIARILPAHFMSPQRFSQIVLTLCGQNPSLMECKPASLIAAVLRCASLSLSPEPALGQAYFVGFKGVVQLIPGYKGLATLAWRSGAIASLGMHVVREGDDFDYGLGTEPFIGHKPRASLNAPVTHAYATAKPIGGSTMFEVLTLEEVEAVRARSPSARVAKGPWITDWDAMARKTAFRRLAKLLPQSTDPLAPLQKALDLDERAELGLKQNNAEDLLGDEPSTDELPDDPEAKQ